MSGLNADKFFSGRERGDTHNRIVGTTAGSVLLKLQANYDDASENSKSIICPSQRWCFFKPDSDKPLSVRTQRGIGCLYDALRRKYPAEIMASTVTGDVGAGAGAGSGVGGGSGAVVKHESEGGCGGLSYDASELLIGIVNKLSRATEWDRFSVSGKIYNISMDKVFSLITAAIETECPRNLKTGKPSKRKYTEAQCWDLYAEYLMNDPVHCATGFRHYLLLGLNGIEYPGLMIFYDPSIFVRDQVQEALPSLLWIAFQQLPPKKVADFCDCWLTGGWEEAQKCLEPKQIKGLYDILRGSILKAFYTSGFDPETEDKETVKTIRQVNNQLSAAALNATINTFDYPRLGKIGSLFNLANLWELHADKSLVLQLRESLKTVSNTKDLFKIDQKAAWVRELVGLDNRIKSLDQFDIETEGLDSCAITTWRELISSALTGDLPVDDDLIDFQPLVDLLAKVEKYVFTSRYALIANCFAMVANMRHRHFPKFVADLTSQSLALTDADIERIMKPNAVGIINIKPYQINQILLHGMTQSRNTWSALYEKELMRTIDFIKSKFSGAPGLVESTWRSSYSGGPYVPLVHKSRGRLHTSGSQDEYLNLYTYFYSLALAPNQTRFSRFRINLLNFLDDDQRYLDYLCRDEVSARILSMTDVQKFLAIFRHCRDRVGLMFEYLDKNSEVISHFISNDRLIANDFSDYLTLYRADKAMGKIFFETLYLFENYFKKGSEYAINPLISVLEKNMGHSDSEVIHSSSIALINRCLAWSVQSGSEHHRRLYEVLHQLLEKDVVTQVSSIPVSEMSLEVIPLHLKGSLSSILKQMRIPINLADMLNRGFPKYIIDHDLVIKRYEKNLEKNKAQLARTNKAHFEGIKRLILNVNNLVYSSVKRFEMTMPFLESLFVSCIFSPSMKEALINDLFLILNNTFCPNNLRQIYSNELIQYTAADLSPLIQCYKKLISLGYIKFLQWHIEEILLKSDAFLMCKDGASLPGLFRILLNNKEDLNIEYAQKFLNLVLTNKLLRDPGVFMEVYIDAVAALCIDNILDYLEYPSPCIHSAEDAESIEFNLGSLGVSTDFIAKVIAPYRPLILPTNVDFRLHDSKQKIDEFLYYLVENRRHPHGELFFMNAINIVSHYLRSSVPLLCARHHELIYALWRLASQYDVAKLKDHVVSKLFHHLPVNILFHKLPRAVDDSYAFSQAVVDVVKGVRDANDPEEVCSLFNYSVGLFAHSRVALAKADFLFMSIILVCSEFDKKDELIDQLFLFLNKVYCPENIRRVYAMHLIRIDSKDLLPLIECYKKLIALDCIEFLQWHIEAILLNSHAIRNCVDEVLLPHLFRLIVDQKVCLNIETIQAFLSLALEQKLIKTPLVFIAMFNEAACIRAISISGLNEYVKPPSACIHTPEDARIITEYLRCLKQCPLHIESIQRSVRTVAYPVAHIGPFQAAVEDDGYEEEKVDSPLRR